MTSISIFCSQMLPAMIIKNYRQLFVINVFVSSLLLLLLFTAFMGEMVIFSHVINKILTYLVKLLLMCYPAVPKNTVHSNTFSLSNRISFVIIVIVILQYIYEGHP